MPGMSSNHKHFDLPRHARKVKTLKFGRPKLKVRLETSMFWDKLKLSRIVKISGQLFLPGKMGNFSQERNEEEKNHSSNPQNVCISVGN